MEGRGGLVWRCIEAAAENARSVDKWRRQRRTLERLPSHLADALFHLLLRRRLLYPSLLEVFQFCVEEVDFHDANYLDAEWMAYLGAFRHLRVLSLSGSRGITNSVIWPLTGMLSLKELDLSRCSRITDAGLAHIVSITHLEKLNISETKVTSKGINLLSCLVNLHSLDLGGLPCIDLAMDSLTSLVQLEYLDVWGSEITDKGSSLLTKFPRLTHLSVAWTDVKNLPELYSLLHLNMSNCTIHSIFQGRNSVKPTLSELLVQGAKFSDVDRAICHLDTSHLSFLDLSSSNVSDFNFLAKMHSLEHLDLSSCLITDDLILPLASLGSALRYLNLSCTKISSQSISILVGNLPNLENLSLSGTLIHDASLQYLGLMPSLKTLDLSKTSIQGFIHMHEGKTLSLPLLRGLCSLENLNLDDTQLRDEVVHSLGFQSGLKTLYLKSDFLSDVSFHTLSSIPGLKILGFRGAVLTDSALLSFEPSEKLEVLDLRGCWLLTKEAISFFCGKFTRITVKHEFVQIEPGQRQGSSKKKPEHARFELSMGNEVKDERIRYTREELMVLNCFPRSEALSSSLFLLPAALKKDEE